MITATDAFDIEEPAALLRREGELRERLAAYFLSMPPLEQQNAAQRLRTRRALSACWDLDIAALLVYRAAGRPVLAGDLNRFLSATLRGAKTMLRGALPVRLSLSTRPFRSVFQPRMAQLTLLALLRDACLAGAQAVHVSVEVSPRTLRLLCASDRAGGYPAAAALAKETAARHGGAFLRPCGSADSLHPFPVMVSALGFSARPAAGTAGFSCPSAEELLANPLSPLYTGLYSVLEE